MLFFLGDAAATNTPSQGLGYVKWTGWGAVAMALGFGQEKLHGKRGILSWAPNN